MRHAVRRVVIGCVCGLVGATWNPVHAGDAPPAAPAGSARLTDADRAFFAWWDAKGFPDVTKLPFVTLGEPEPRSYAGRGPEEGPELPAGAFLIADTGKEVTLFRTDLRTVRAPLKSALPKGKAEGRESGVEYRKADLAAWVRQGLDILAKDPADTAWFDKSDPFKAHRWSYPNQAFRIAVLARALAGRGEEALARTMCDRALFEGTRPSRTEQYGKDDPRPRTSYESIQGAIEREVEYVLREKFGDPRLSWEDLLAAHEAWARAFSPESLTSTEGAVAVLRAMVAEGRARKSPPAKPADRPPPLDRMATLVRDLQDVASSYYDTWGYRAPGDKAKEGPKPADVQLLAAGFEAVPALLDALDDLRFSRTLEIDDTGHAQYRGDVRVLRVGQLAWTLLDKIASGALTAAGAGGPPTSGRPTRRRAAEAWYATVKDRGEKTILMDQVAQGTYESRAAADRLVKLDPEAAVQPLETGIAASDPGAARSNLVSVLTGLKSPTVVAALLRLLEPLKGTDDGVSVAASLWQRGRREGLDALIRAWTQAGAAREDGPPGLGRAFGAFEGRNLVESLVGTGHPDAVRALAADIAKRSAGDRVEIVRAFSPPRKDGFRSGYVLPMKAEAEPLIEALLAERLADGERAHGLYMGTSSDEGDDPIGKEPVVGEMAAWTLAERYPTRWKFNPKASAKDRAAARTALADKWRAAHGQPSIAETKPKIERVPSERTKPLLKAWLDAADDNARDVAALDLTAAGLGALPDVQAARDALKKDDPRRAKLDVVVRRLASVTREVRWSEKGPKPNAALIAYVDAVKGQPLTGPWITGLWRQVAIETPEGSTGIDLIFDRPGDGTGGVLTLELTTDYTPWGGGDGAWILAGDGMEHVDDDFLKDEKSWWHEARGPQVDERLQIPENRALRMRWTIKRGRG
ncbi:MAG: hypothetical protein U1E39_17285 [Planctomycetota bacterium]